MMEEAKQCPDADELAQAVRNIFGGGGVAGGITRQLSNGQRYAIQPWSMLEAEHKRRATTRAELAALEAELGERVQELAAAHATIHQLGENAAKAAERVAVLEGAVREADETAARYEERLGARDDEMEALGKANARLREALGVACDDLEELGQRGRARLARAALTEPTDG